MKFLFIIGAPKAGTTTLANLLNSRESLCLGKIKEPCFFTNYGEILWKGPAKLSNIIKTKSEYLKNFSQGENAEWFIDASTDYLSCSASIEKLKSWSEQYECRFICILRDPVERAVSQYQHTIRDRFEKESLINAIRLEEKRIKDNWHPLFYHVRRSKYYSDCTKYIDTFAEKFLLLDFHELKNTAHLMYKIEAFLELPHRTVIPELPHHNESYVQRSGFIRNILYNNFLKSILRPLIPKDFRKKLWSNLSRINRTKYTPTPNEIETLRKSLKDDIELCKSDSRFPTQSWSSDKN